MCSHEKCQLSNLVEQGGKKQCYYKPRDIGFRWPWKKPKHVVLLTDTYPYKGQYVECSVLDESDKQYKVKRMSKNNTYSAFPSYSDPEWVDKSAVISEFYR